MTCPTHMSHQHMMSHASGTKVFHLITFGKLAKKMIGKKYLKVYWKWPKIETHTGYNKR